MTNDTTSRRRVLPSLVAGIVAALALAWAAGDAQASSLDRELRAVLEHGAPGGKQVGRNQIRWPKAGVTLTLSTPGRARAAAYADCPRGYACLWQDANGTSRRVQFSRYGTYNLSGYGMAPGTHGAASSYYNNQTGGAAAYLSGSPGTFWMWSWGNLPRSWNNRAARITLTS